MPQFDRRDWLRALGLGLGGAVAPRTLFATSAAVALRPVSDAAPVRLSLKENPFGPAPSVVAALQQEFARLCRYSDAAVGGLLNSRMLSRGAHVRQAASHRLMREG